MGVRFRGAYVKIAVTDNEALFKVGPLEGWASYKTGTVYVAVTARSPCPRTIVLPVLILTALQFCRGRQPMHLDQLKHLAHTATAGTWTYHPVLPNFKSPPTVRTESGEVVMETWNIDYRDCHFIAAANPAVVLDLISTIEALQAKVAELEQQVTNSAVTVQR